MANGPMITPSFLLSDARYNQNLPPSSFDPNYTVDPTSAIAAQQAYLKQMFQMQNPRLALPQQFGQAISAAIQGQPQQQQAPQQGMPPDPTAAAIHKMAVANGASGMDAGEALYKAAAQAEQDPTLSSMPNADKLIEKARTYAIEKLKYDPNIGKAAKASAQNETENLVNNQGQVQAFRKGTPQWQQAIDSGQYRKAGDTQELAIGSTHEVKIGGKYVTYKVMPDMSQKVVGTSSQPMQYQVSGTPEQMQQGGLISTTGTTAGNDKNYKELADRGIATTNAIRGIDKVLDTVDSNAQGVGTPGDLFEKGNNIVSGARTLAAAAGFSPDILKSSTYDWKNLDKMTGTLQGNAAAATKYHGQMVALAYMMAAAQSNNNTDEKMTKQRVEANLEMLAEHSNDPSVIKNTMAEVRQQLKDNYATEVSTYKGTSPYDNPVDNYEADRAKSKAPKPTVGPYSDAEKEARYQAWKASQAGK